MQASHSLAAASTSGRCRRFRADEAAPAGGQRIEPAPAASVAARRPEQLRRGTPAAEASARPRSSRGRSAVPWGSTSTAPEPADGAATHRVCEGPVGVAHDDARPRFPELEHRASWGSPCHLRRNLHGPGHALQTVTPNNKEPEHPPGRSAAPAVAAKTECGRHPEYIPVRGRGSPRTDAPGPGTVPQPGRRPRPPPPTISIAVTSSPPQRHLDTAPPASQHILPHQGLRPRQRSGRASAVPAQG